MSEIPPQTRPVPDGVTQEDLDNARALREFYFQHAQDPDQRGTNTPAWVRTLTAQERARMDAAVNWIEHPFVP